MDNKNEDEDRGQCSLHFVFSVNKKHKLRKVRGVQIKYVIILKD